MFMELRSSLASIGDIRVANSLTPKVHGYNELPRCLEEHSMALQGFGWNHETGLQELEQIHCDHIRAAAYCP